MKIHSNLSSEDVYAGVFENDYGVTFGSGAGFWLSKDNIGFILDNKDKIDYSWNIDDVNIGALMTDKNKQPLPRYNIVDNNNVENKKELLENIIKSNHFHIRIKNENNRNLDIEYMQEFTNILYSE